MIHTRKITLKKIITLFGIIAVALHISSYTDCMTTPHPAPDDVPPPAEKAAQAPAKPEKPQPAEKAPPAPAKQPENPQPVQQPVQAPTEIIIPSIFFAPNIVQVTEGLDQATSASNDRILRRVADILNNYGTYKVRVEGHANPTFPPDSEQRAGEESGTEEILGLQPLSEQRAKTVVEYLVKLGVDRSRLTPIGMGGKNVRAGFTDKPNWWKNRRVDFFLEKP